MEVQAVSAQVSEDLPAEEAGAQPISFVVRIWRQMTPAGPEYRGWVEHVQSGKRTFFLGLDGLPSLVGGYLGLPMRRARWHERLTRWRNRVAAWFGRAEEA